MHPPMIAPASVRSLFQPYWRDERAAFRVLASPALEQVFLHEIRCGKCAAGLRGADPDPREHLHAGLLATLEYAARRCGIPAPADLWTRRDVQPLMATVFRHRMIDGWRRQRRQLLLDDPDRTEAVAAPVPESAERGPPDPVRRAAYRQLLAGGRLRLGHALAFGAARDLLLVDVVADWLRSGDGSDPALRRPPDETAELLSGWLDRVERAPAPCRARRTLAWITRSTDRAGPAEWQAEAPGATNAAMDLLLKWQTRAEAAIPAHLLREIGPVAVLGMRRGVRASPGSPPRVGRASPGLAARPRGAPLRAGSASCSASTGTLRPRAGP